MRFVRKWNFVYQYFKYNKNVLQHCFSSILQRKISFLKIGEGGRFQHVYATMCLILSAPLFMPLSRVIKMWITQTCEKVSFGNLENVTFNCNNVLIGGHKNMSFAD